MQRLQINIISSEGRQVSVNPEFKKVMTIPVHNGVLNLTQVKMPAILKVVEYATHHEFNPIAEYPDQPLKSHSLKSLLKNEWDRRFFKDLAVDTAVDIINACEYIGYGSLSQVCQAYIATIFRARNVEELIEIFQVNGEFNEAKAMAEMNFYY